MARFKDNRLRLGLLGPTAALHSTGWPPTMVCMYKTSKLLGWGEAPGRGRPRGGGSGSKEQSSNLKSDNYCME
ncbi:hypothetical protein TWF225_005938 [Orbilia oligospora]|uniref:Uncharacterized protein n=1 Tax=Orbilia oligospora TaxID=2813651 RepID=A0A7C8JUL7_ORBOL|nr:hypothetical protein TWF751_004893 [Orbilia oligospora]KAF3184653.1 hypothetical protein TWF225_005938 [Orbilia oligospora]KAF3260937.1 hypothetical protein TWF217_004781 [Orbilia oligospora]TGJ71230.1 hypothetical protein EYR41_003211 [Orbilia oligospora]